MQQAPGDFSGDLDQMNLSSHTPFSSATLGPGSAPITSPTPTNLVQPTTSTTSNSTSNSTSTSTSSSLPHAISSASLREASLGVGLDILNTGRSDNSYANELSTKTANATINPLFSNLNQNNQNNQYNQNNNGGDGLVWSDREQNNNRNEYYTTSRVEGSDVGEGGDGYEESEGGGEEDGEFQRNLSGQGRILSIHELICYLCF